MGMPTVLGSLRRLLFTPRLEEVTFQYRKFPVPISERTCHLESIPQAVICGFEWGMDARDQTEVECRLRLVAPELRGFAYEGVTMAYTIRDVAGGSRGNRTRDLLLGSGHRHIFLAYIGIGFAMARLPRPLWRMVVPDLTGSPYHPTMSWLAVDGYGFDRAYFDTRKWVYEQRRPAPYPWEGAPDYFLRAVDQGVGRALWFIHGADPVRVATAVADFAPRRQADLWSGVGLAAAFAGGADPDGLAGLRHKAGAEWPHLAQGAVFAARARTFSGVVPGHTEAAVTALAGLSVAAASTLADAAEVPPVSHGGVPAYELWRNNVRAHFTSG
jgi:hypothetical protein